MGVQKDGAYPLNLVKIETDMCLIRTVSRGNYYQEEQVRPSLNYVLLPSATSTKR